MISSILILISVLVLLILAISKFKVHPFVALLLSAIVLGLSFGMGGEKTVSALLDGFGNTIQWIAIVVILGAFIGEILNETGGANRISKAVIKRTGDKKLPWAMGITGYIISIPVFIDVAYIILQPVTEKLAVKSKTPILVLGLSLAAGLAVSHTLIPPTPGPLAVLSMLDADIGRLLIINLFVGIFALIGGVYFAKFYCISFKIDYDKKLSQREVEVDEQDEKQSIVILDLLPILVPIILMGLGAFLDKFNSNIFYDVLVFLSIPMIAVMIGALIAVLQYKLTSNKKPINNLVDQAIIKSALVIIITGAGGAFGYVIKESGLQDSLASIFESLPYLGFILPFLIAAILTTSTGSITVSLIGAASIVGPLASSMPYSPEIMAALIGCGAFCVFHANSSFFWLLSRLHEVPISVLYRTYTLQSLVMGLSGLIGVIILWLLGVR